MPFLQFTRSLKAGSHLSSPMGESSKIVPVFSENLRMLCFMAHFHTRAFSSHVTRSDPHLGTPDYTAGPAKLHQEPAAVWKSSKWMIASRRVAKFILYLSDFHASLASI